MWGQKQSMLVAVNSFEEARVIAVNGNEIHDAVCQEGTNVVELPGWHQDDAMPKGGIGLYVWEGQLGHGFGPHEYTWDGKWRSASVDDFDDFLLMPLVD